MKQFLKIVFVMFFMLPFIANAQTDSLITQKKKWQFSIIQKIQEGNLRVVHIPAF